MPINQTEAGRQWEMLQKARANLRHLSYRYAHCKKDKFTKDRAGAELEQAALAYATAASIWGSTADCAKPAGKAGDDWKEAHEPENLLRVWKEGLPAKDAKREAGKIVDDMLKRGGKP